MLRYEPLRGSHAVQEAVFFIQFAPEIPKSAFAQISAQCSEIEFFLPLKSDIRVMQFTQNEDGSSSFSSDIGGLEFSRKDGDSPPTWLMRFGAEGVSVHCMDYTRYDDVWERARGLLLKALETVPSGHAIGAVGMRYIDRFRYVSEFGEYDLKVLFKEPNRYLSPRCFEAGPRWHCHNGWFAPVQGMDADLGFDAESLNQLNLASAEEITPAGSSMFVTIDHNLIVRPLQLGDFSVSEQHHAWLDQLMLALHKDNKRTMYQLLTGAVCKRLNLVADGRG
ncbi:TIGR04255 family protein [Sphingobium sp. CFD-1]|uniref:TIGR04255 family protein n=1 Tax=Sphingobium sp. CFD-1 TaxID=2878545 RepID=UPI00214B2709|nr:TIGR04255 family protein [Sphingobium sp. CFD-1]